jgi:sarcosine oxidase / L-pipecolate oxidase
VRVAVVGAGIFGVTSALALRGAGHDVTVVDPGPLPHPDAASTDISKLVRADYGEDDFYTAAMSRALDGWDRWNAHWERPLYHPTGVCFLKSLPFTEDTFEASNISTLDRHGLPTERLTAHQVAQRFPQWSGVNEGYISHRAGWAESGEVVSALLRQAFSDGVVHIQGQVSSVANAHDIELTNGKVLSFQAVVVAAGAWTTMLLPELQDRIEPVGQPVFHVKPAHPDAWCAPRFLPWGNDTAETGWYGFCSNGSGIFKFANHGPGRVVDPVGPREVDRAHWEPIFRDFLKRRLPGLFDAPIVATRLCLYSDSFDGDFFIDAVPGRDGVFVAAGGSGHGFKFAPVLGGWVNAAIEGSPEPRFAWRERGQRRTEAARHLT